MNRVIQDTLTLLEHQFKIGRVHIESELYRESFHLTDIVKQLPPVFEHYWGNPANTTCRKCGRKHAKP